MKRGAGLLNPTVNGGGRCVCYGDLELKAQILKPRNNISDLKNIMIL